MWLVAIVPPNHHLRGRVLKETFGIPCGSTWFICNPCRKCCEDMIESNSASTADRLIHIIARTMITSLNPIIEDFLFGAIGQPAKLKSQRGMPYLTKLAWSERMKRFSSGCLSNCTSMSLSCAADRASFPSVDSPSPCTSRKCSGKSGDTYPYQLWADLSD